MIKIAHLTIALLTALYAGNSMATTTETVYNGKVINSTATFSNVGVSGPGNLQLDQTTLTNLNNASPPVTLQLIISSITYIDPSVTGNNSTPSITFTWNNAPTLGNINGSLNGGTITLTAAAPIASGVTQDNVVFTLASPIVFAPVDESNPGNTNTGTGTWNEPLSNLEPSPDSIILYNGTSAYQVQNQNFTFSGSVEVFYAAPEPASLSLIALGLGAMVPFARRRLYS